MPLEWRQLGTEVPFCKPPCYEEPFISWDLLFPPALTQKAFTHQTSMLPSPSPKSTVCKEAGRTARKHKGTARIWQDKKSVSEAFARCWYHSRQEEGASGNSPASSGALQMKQSQEPLGGSCLSVAFPSTPLPACTAAPRWGGGLGKPGGWRCTRDSTSPNSALERKLEAGWHGNSQVLFLPE